jgi:hypothetical protein
MDTPSKVNIGLWEKIFHDLPKCCTAMTTYSQEMLIVVEEMFSGVAIYISVDEANKFVLTGSEA